MTRYQIIFAIAALIYQSVAQQHFQQQQFPQDHGQQFSQGRGQFSQDHGQQFSQGHGGQFSQGHGQQFGRGTEEGREGRRAPPKFEGIPSTVYSGPGKDGSVNFAYQTADGQMRAETTGADGAVKGSYSYVGGDGKKVTINYVADKNGFRASGPTLPTPPPAVGPAPAAPQQEQFPQQPQHHQQRFPQQDFQDRFPQGNEGFSQHDSQSFAPQTSFNFPQSDAGQFGSFGGQSGGPRGAPQHPSPPSHFGQQPFPSQFGSQGGSFGFQGNAFPAQARQFSPETSQFSGGSFGGLSGQDDDSFRRPQFEFGG